MKKWSLWCILFVGISFVSACDINPSCASNCTSNTSINVTFDYTLAIIIPLLLEAKVAMKGPLIVSTRPEDNSVQFNVKLTKIKSFQEGVQAQFSEPILQQATYVLNTKDPNFSCAKNETPQIGKSPKYPGLYVVEYQQCGLLALPEGTPDPTASNGASNGKLLLMFSFPPPPCQTLQDGLLLCFPKP